MRGRTQESQWGSRGNEGRGMRGSGREEWRSPVGGSGMRDGRNVRPEGGRIMRGSEQRVRERQPGVERRFDRNGIDRGAARKQPGMGRGGRQSDMQGKSQWSGGAGKGKQPPVDLNEIARKAMINYGFEPVFPNNVKLAVEKLDGSLPQKLLAEGSVRDMRNLLWSSIDNIDTEDLDQIEYCEQGQNGEINVKVAIADVDAYVPKNSVLDLHARKNTTSIYTGIEIFPMLPDKLSKDLSSLPPGKERLAMVIEYTVLPKGNVRPGKMFHAIVENKAKLVYEQVGGWLEQKGPIPALVAEMPGLKGQLLLQDEASTRLGKYRMEQGALELETPEARAVVEQGKVLGLYVVEDNQAKRIIENFMIGANGVISGFLEKTGTPTIQRVVRTPKYWDEIVEFAKSHGTRLPNQPDAMALSIFLEKEKAAAPEKFNDLSLRMVKLLGPGEYVMYDQRKPIGHFCLAVTSYTHATAPNRRYPDLIIQRLLKAAIDGRPSPYDRKEISQAAAWCTDRERAGKRVERFVTKAEAATLLEGRLGQEFDAIVTGASEKGVYARLLDPPVEGMIVNQRRGIAVGQDVRVKLVNLDPRNGYVDFELI